MNKPRLLGAVCVYLIVASINANASLISTDWQTVGDNLITYDDVSDLRWLDLTETNDMTRLDVLAQLGSGGQFDGWRYATSDEVVTLWSNFGIDLSEGATTFVSGFDALVIDATNILGNILCEANCVWWPNGALGLTSTQSVSPGRYDVIGALYETRPVPTTEYHVVNFNSALDNTATTFQGHYLVQSTAVPVPGAIWLFGSGLLGLIGIVKRKRSA